MWPFKSNKYKLSKQEVLDWFAQEARQNDAPEESEPVIVLPKGIEAALKKEIRRRLHGDYPETVAEVLDDNLDFEPETNAAMERFKASHPWRGSQEEIQAKFHVLNEELAKVYKIKTPTLLFLKRPSVYVPILNLINLQVENDGRYSVVVFLHEFGHALKKKERETCTWSINLFRKHFPKSFSRLEPNKHLLYRKDKKGSKLKQKQKLPPPVPPPVLQ